MLHFILYHFPFSCFIARNIHGSYLMVYINVWGINVCNPFPHSTYQAGFMINKNVLYILIILLCYPCRWIQWKYWPWSSYFVYLECCANIGPGWQVRCYWCRQDISVYPLIYFGALLNLSNIILAWYDVQSNVCYQTIDYFLYLYSHFF